MQPTESTVIAGKYRLERKLGEGGMGSVWRAEHLSLRSKVAIKLIEQSIAENPDALARFLREAQAAASLRSPHVVQILDHGVDDKIPYIAMEMLEGESLAQRLERLGRLPPRETARIVTHVARAMSRAHEAGIVHRDLKPDNIFLVPNDDEEIAKVLDFGIAKTSALTPGSGVSSNTRTGIVLGTPYYMSPEQAEGTKIDARADIWSLGVIAFECLTGRRPFEGDSLATLLLAICSRPMPTPSHIGLVPSGFDQWFAKACSRDLEARYSSAKQAAAELKPLCGGDPADNAGRSGGYPQSVLSDFGQPQVTVPFGAGQSSPGLSATNGARPATARSAGAGPVIAVVATLGSLLAIAAVAFFVWRSRAHVPASGAASGSAIASEPAPALPVVAAPAAPAVSLPEPTVAPTAPSAEPHVPPAVSTPLVASATSGKSPAAVPPKRAPAGVPPSPPPKRPPPPASPAGDNVNLGI